MFNFFKNINWHAIGPWFLSTGATVATVAAKVSADGILPQGSQLSTTVAAVAMVGGLLTHQAANKDSWPQVPIIKTPEDALALGTQVAAAVAQDDPGTKAAQVAASSLAVVNQLQQAAQLAQLAHEQVQQTIDTVKQASTSVQVAPAPTAQDVLAVAAAVIGATQAPDQP